MDTGPFKVLLLAAIVLVLLVLLAVVTVPQEQPVYPLVGACL